MLPMRGDETIESVLDNRHASYAKKAELFKNLSYGFRVSAGLSAALLPFIVAYSQIAATGLAVIVAVVTVLDTVFVPKDKWKIYSRASDRLWVEQVRARGEYDKYKNHIDEILKTEAADLELLTGLQEMLDQIKKQQPPAEKRT
jgi:hypothetical protein